ncbi:MAG: tRNA preQ1(34) S-adenosylmethionine ribosyltransferase-isomerase QueA [Nitrospiraceae bacterium]|nr:tRNA preQ1(34) S-adenosylmethionine ribosyltransferase-isomerase QueA [Nitrospiraceae bacterium]
MEVKEFDYILPENLIALEPAAQRDASRLLVLGKSGMEHRHFRDLPEYLEKGDMLLINDTRVMPVRLMGVKPTGGRLEVLLVKEISGKKWEALSKGKYTGTIRISDELSLELKEGREAVALCDGDAKAAIFRAGQMPLPPYIRRQPNELDRERYQTVYAGAEGSIAAPTAGLHFTEGLLGEIERKGVSIRKVTLHVGKGTFVPIKCEYLDGHRMEPERFEFHSGLFDEIKKTRANGGRVFAVGTTTTRALEGVLSGRCRIENANGKVRGTTDVFIYPGFEFRGVDCLVTNFHLPRSTPLMLACAFSDKGRMLEAYAQAVSLGYRFFSYGDAMLILDR